MSHQEPVLTMQHLMECRPFQTPPNQVPSPIVPNHLTEPSNEIPNYCNLENRTSGTLLNNAWPFSANVGAPNMSMKHLPEWTSSSQEDHYNHNSSDFLNLEMKRESGASLSFHSALPFDSATVQFKDESTGDQGLYSDHKSQEQYNHLWRRPTAGGLPQPVDIQAIPNVQRNLTSTTDVSSTYLDLLLSTDSVQTVSSASSQVFKIPERPSQWMKNHLDSQTKRTHTSNHSKFPSNRNKAPLNRTIDNTVLNYRRKTTLSNEKCSKITKQRLLQHLRLKRKSSTGGFHRKSPAGAVKAKIYKQNQNTQQNRQNLPQTRSSLTEFLNNMEPTPQAIPVETVFDFDSVEYSIRIVEHFINMYHKKESNPTTETTANVMVDPPLNNNEMAMSSEDFDHLLFDHPISKTMQESFCVPMNVETQLTTTGFQQESNDNGFCDDQTMISTDTEFESVPTSPSLSSTFFSHSPSSESGIEDDQDDDNSKLESFETFTDLSNHGEQTFPTLSVQTQPAAPSSISDAYEELKHLLYTVVTTNATSLPTVPNTINTSLVTSMVNIPVSSDLTRECSSAQAGVSQNTTVTASNASSGKLTSIPADSKTNLKCVRRTRRQRDKPKLVILDEPEENYRARYESEGCRGPIHGSSESTYPTIKVSGYSGPVWITVYLTTSSGLPHYHSIHGPGSTKVPCKEITLPGGIPAVQLMVDPDSKMTAVMDSLSIRRLRNWEGDKELKKRGIDPRTWKRERKEARLLFQAEIPGEDGQPDIKLTCKSRIFQCSSSGPTGSPEIWWTSRTEGSVEGKEEMGLIGKKFPSDVKVRFYANLSSGETWESFAEVDKSKTHQGAAVILTPPYSNQDILFPVKVNIELVSGNAKNGKCSEPIEFTYNPRQEILSASVTPSGHSLGGILAGLPGGFNTCTTTIPQSFSPLVNIPPSLPNVTAIEASTLMSTVSTPIVPQQNKKEPDVNDWQRLCIQIKELQQKGLLNANQIKNLCSFIQRKDLLLLQAFRSANNAGTREECQTKFKQYLMGLVGNV